MVDNALKMGHGGGINGLRKQQLNAEKHAFMKGQLSKQEQINKLYQIKIKEPKTAVAM